MNLFEEQNFTLTTFCNNNKLTRWSANLSSSHSYFSFGIICGPSWDHLRSRIICSPFWGSFWILYKSVNPRAYKPPPSPAPFPLRFFGVFSKTMKHQHLTFSVAVRLSLARILRQVYWWSVTMVTRYDVIRSRWSNQFWVKMNVFSTSFNNKSKARVCKDAKCLFMCYFTRQAQKIPFIAVTPSSML